jgi:transposase
MIIEQLAKKYGIGQSAIKRHLRGETSVGFQLGGSAERYVEEVNKRTAGIIETKSGAKFLTTAEVQDITHKHFVENYNAREIGLRFYPKIHSAYVDDLIKGKYRSGETGVTRENYRQKEEERRARNSARIVELYYHDEHDYSTLNIAKMLNVPEKEVILTVKGGRNADLTGLDHEAYLRRYHEKKGDMRHLTKQEIKEIVGHRLSNTYTKHDLAEMYKVDEKTIYNVVRAATERLPETGRPKFPEFGVADVCGAYLQFVVANAIVGSRPELTFAPFDGLEYDPQGHVSRDQK